MSSIERAMEKLGGAPDEAEEKVEEGQATAVAPPSTDEQSADGRDDAPPPVEVEAQSGPAPAAPPAESGAEARAAAPAAATDAAVPAPGDAPAPDSNRPAAAPPPAARPAPVPGAPGSKNYVALDIERLAAAGMLVPDQPTNRQSEEYQRIKRRLLGNLVPGMLSPDRPANLILITSSVPGEGKTFTSVNLSISIAMEVDHTVLAIDTDVVKRDMSKAFGVDGRMGLYDLLADPSLRLEDLLMRTSMPNLVVLPAGANRDGSTELLASMRMKELAAEISQRYPDRVIIFDSPPILATTTATALAPLMGQVLLVAEAGNTKQETVKESLARLDHVRITGLILNKSKQVVTTAYDYYGYYYPGTH